jgi:hypothetical protein
VTVATVCPPPRCSVLRMRRRATGRRFLVCMVSAGARGSASVAATPKPMTRQPPWPRRGAPARAAAPLLPKGPGIARPPAARHRRTRAERPRDRSLGCCGTPSRSQPCAPRHSGGALCADTARPTRSPSQSPTRF